MILAKVVEDEAPARWPGTRRCRQLAKVRDYANAALPIDAKPGAAGGKITAGEDLLVLPFGERRGGSCVKLIAIGRKNEAVMRMRLPGEHE